MSGLNLRDYNLELELSIPESISCTKREVSFPITNIDFPTFKITRDIVGLFPNTSFGRDLSKGVEDEYEPKPYDYFSVPRVNKKGDYKIHCLYFVKEGLLNSLDTWWKNLNDSTFGKVKRGDLYVSSRIKGYHKQSNTLSKVSVKCSRTFIIDCYIEGVDCDWLNITFMCDEMIDGNKQ